MAAQEQEDAIDLQDLQAQIDLSMSFAQNLVTSWVQPTQFSKSGRQSDLESEIKEYMRRPARLGVGAPVPETQSLAREAAKLKNKLDRGQKRQREAKNTDSAPLPSDDEEESRAGAIKKKARKDPFGITPKKGKEEKFNGGSTTQIKAVATHTMTSQSKPTTTVVKAPHDAPAQILTNSSPATGDKISSPSSKVSGVYLQSPTQSTPTPTSPPVKKIIGASPPATPLLTPAHHAELINRPLLNLGGSPNEEEAEAEKVNSSPKKKRKRRKKKKPSQDVGKPLTERP